jgi:hypothetical protein
MLLLKCCVRNTLGENGRYRCSKNLAQYRLFGLDLSLFSSLAPMARDKYHKHVRNSLENDGWTITHDPYRFRYLSSKDQEVDLGAEKNLIGAAKGSEKIAVEVKSFLDDSVLQDIYKAFGQYLIYSSGLEEVEPDRTLYLAIPEEVFLRDINQNVFLTLLQKYNIKIFIFSIAEEKIKSTLP